MSDRLNEFFAREATEYLAELEALLGGTRAPDPEELLRLSTGVRGSVEMAEAGGVVILAEALEDAARGVAAGETFWSESLRDLTVSTVRELRELIAAFNRWGGAENDRLRLAVARWDRTLSGPTDQDREESGRIVPISDLFYDDAGPHIVEENAGPLTDAPGSAETASRDGAVAEEGVAIPITDLLFSGQAALEEALSLRPRIEAAARQGEAASLDALIAELFDLVELGIGPEHLNEG